MEGTKPRVIVVCMFASESTSFLRPSKHTSSPARIVKPCASRLCGNVWLVVASSVLWRVLYEKCWSIASSKIRMDIYTKPQAVTPWRNESKDGLSAIAKYGRSHSDHCIQLTYSRTCSSSRAQ